MLKIVPDPPQYANLPLEDILSCTDRERCALVRRQVRLLQRLAVPVGAGHAGEDARRAN